LPERYGLHEFVSQQEIRHSHVNGEISPTSSSCCPTHTNFSLSLAVLEYFKGTNWKVHPDFVYCEYNSLKDMDKELENSENAFFRDREDSFDTPEEQVSHFLSRAGKPGWKWMSVSPLPSLGLRLTTAVRESLLTVNLLFRSIICPTASCEKSPATSFPWQPIGQSLPQPATSSQSELTEG
jgi:hypothetical protein